MKVEIWLKDNSVPLKYEDASTYQKGQMYCVYMGDTIDQYPLCDIYKVRLSSFTHSHRPEGA